MKESTDDVDMRKRTVALLAALVALNVSLWIATSGSALSASLGSYFFGPKMVRAEVILQDGGVVHDFRIDRGRVRAVDPASITLGESDGTVATIPISSSTRITLNGTPVGINALRRPRVRAEVVRDGAAPATSIQARTPR